jgi:hypothetical protein
MGIIWLAIDGTYARAIAPATRHLWGELVFGRKLMEETLEHVQGLLAAAKEIAPTGESLQPGWPHG